MPDPGETPRLLESVCARLCHDLSSLVGALGNALDMLAVETDGESEVLSYALSASQALTQRLRLMRAAWGPAMEPLTPAALMGLAAAPMAARRIGLDLGGLPPETVFPPGLGRVVLNFILLGADCLPRGGAIVLSGSSEDLLIRIDGQGAAWPEDMNAILTATPASVQKPLTLLLARDQGLLVTSEAGRTRLRVTRGP